MIMPEDHWEKLLQLCNCDALQSLSRLTYEWIFISNAWNSILEVKYVWGISRWKIIISMYIFFHLPLTISNFLKVGRYEYHLVFSDQVQLSVDFYRQDCATNWWSSTVIVSGRSSCSSRSNRRVSVKKSIETIFVEFTTSLIEYSILYPNDHTVKYFTKFLI